jgi:hypothetical protein
MTKVIVNVFGLIIAIGIQILVMINGWGLEPKSWMWIILLGTFGNLAVHLAIAISNKETK